MYQIALQHDGHNPDLHFNVSWNKITVFLKLLLIYSYYQFIYRWDSYYTATYMHICIILKIIYFYTLCLISSIIFFFMDI